MPNVRVKTTDLNQTTRSIVAIPDHYVAFSAQIPATAATEVNGKKYILAGTTVTNATTLDGRSTGLQVKTGKVDQIKVDGVEYMTFGLDRFTQGKLMAGEATVQAFSLESGKQSTPVKVNVVAATEVKTLSIGNGPKTIVAGEDAELSYSATDADGKPVTDFDILSRVTLNGGKEVNGKKGLRFEKKDGKVVLIYHPVADANIDRAVTEYVSYVTQTNNVGNAVLTVNPARVPTKIAGLKKDVATALTGKDGAGNTLTIKAGDIALKDQYGDDLDVKNALGTDYDILVKLEEGKKNNGFSAYGTNANDTYVASFGSINLGHDVALTGDPSLVTATVTNPAISASFGVELSLLKKKSATEVVEVSGSKYSFRIHAAPVKDLKNIKVEIPLAKAGATAKITVKATIDGKAVELKSGVGADYQIIDNKVPATLPVGTTKGKANASIMLLDGSGKIITQEYEFSDATPVLSSAEIQDGAAGQLDHTQAIDAAKVLATLELKDQYGYAVTPAPTTAFLTFSNVKDGVAITSNGSSSATIAAEEAAKLAVGDKIRIKVAFPGTSYVFEDDFIIK